MKRLDTPALKSNDKKKIIKYNSITVTVSSQLFSFLSIQIKFKLYEEMCGQKNILSLALSFISIRDGFY